MRRTSGNNEICNPYLNAALAQRPETYGRLDLVAFGFPCQDISSGNPNGQGLAGNRSGIFFECMRVVRLLSPQWVVIENVPRLLSINQGRDMAVVLQTLAQCGYGWSYRLLDSKYFGVAQGRKRIFIVGRLGKQCPPEILFHAESDKGDVPADAGTPPLGKSVTTRNRHDASVETFIAEPQSHCIQGQTGRRANAGWDTYIAKTVGCGGRGYNGWMWQENYIAEFDADGKRSPAGISKGLDTARGTVIGNAVTVPVIEWIGKRIVKYTESNNE